VRTRIAETVGHVTVPHKVQNWHHAIDRLLKDDEKRREKQLTDRYAMSWNSPLFDTPFQRRRLRILNSLFFATARMNAKSSIYGREAREGIISFSQQHVYITLDRSMQSSRRGQVSSPQPDSNDAKLSLSICSGPNSEAKLATWQDDDGGKLETRMTEIAIQIILTAEIQYRENAARRHQWRIERKAELEGQERQRKLAAEREQRERQRRIEQARIDRLLRDAAAFQKAREIRHYVEAIRLAQPCHESASSEAVEQWSNWALAQADRIDPAMSGIFLKSMEDEAETKK
jgi:hypothetical protein